MAASRPFVVVMMLALVALSAQAQEKTAASGKSIPGYSLEQISRNFRESVAKAVEERLRKTDSSSRVVAVNRQAPTQRRVVPGVLQPAQPGVPNQQVRQEPVVSTRTAISQEHNHRLAATSHQQISQIDKDLVQGSQPTINQVFESQRFSGLEQVQKTLQTGEAYYQGDERIVQEQTPVQISRVHGPVVTEQDFGQHSTVISNNGGRTSGQVFREFEEEFRRAAPNGQILYAADQPDVNQLGSGGHVVAEQHEQGVQQGVPSGVSYKTNQVFESNIRSHQENVPTSQVQQHQSITPTVRTPQAPSTAKFSHEQVFESDRVQAGNTRGHQQHRTPVRGSNQGANTVVPMVAPQPPRRRVTVTRKPAVGGNRRPQVVSERFGVAVNSDDGSVDDNEQLYQQQAEDARYSFSAAVQDGINDNQHTREEQRDGLNLKGKYSYSDGFFKRTVHYEADEKGYRVTKQEVQSLGDGPRINPDGVAEVNTSLGGSYSITAQEIKDVRDAEKEGQRLV